MEELESRLAPASHTWSGAVDGSWSNPGNWSVGGVPSNGESGAIVLNFGSVGAGAVAMTNDIDGLNVSQMFFTVSGYSLAGGASPVVMNLSNSISVSSGGTTFSASNLSINLDATAQITASGGTFTINSPISSSGTFGLTKLGNGSLVLGGTNTYTGVTTVSAGAIGVTSLANGGAASNLGQASSDPANIVLSGGTLSYLGSSVAVDRGITVNSTTGGTISVSSAAANLTVTGAIVSNTTSIAVVTKSGIGTLTTGGSGNNAFVGFGVPSGTLVLDKASVTGSVAAINGNLTISSGATVRIAGTGGDQIVTTANVTASGTLDLNGNSEGFNTFNGGVNGSITNSVVSTVTLTVGESNGAGTFNGVIQDGGAGKVVGLTKKGSGTQTFGGTAANTYTGPTIIAGAGSATTNTLVISKPTGVSAVSSSIQIGDGGAGASVLQLGAADLIPNAATMTFVGSAGNNAYFKMMGFNETIASIADATAAGVVETMEAEVVNVSSTLTLSGSVDTSFNGTLRDKASGSGTGTLILAKTGASTQTLAGANITYTGATTASAGTLKLSDTTAFVSAITNTSTVEFNVTTAVTLGATVSIAGANVWNKTGDGVLTFGGAGRVVSFSGQINVLGGTLQNGGNSVNWSSATGSMFIDANCVFDAQGDAVFLDKLTGTGTFRNTYGNVTGQSGTLASTEKLTIGVSGGSSEFGGVFADSGTAGNGANFGLLEIVKQGAGTFTLAGASTFKGGASVVSGKLNLKNTLALQNSTVTTGGTGLTFDTLVVPRTFTLGGLTGSTNLALVDTAVAPNAITLNVGNNDSSGTYSGVLSGAGSFGKIGAGTLTLSGASTYTGSTAFNGGILNAGGADGGTSGPFGNGGAMTFGGGTLQYSAANNRDYSSRLSTAGGQDFKIDTGLFTITFASAIAGAGSGLTKLGTGTLNLTGAVANTYSGATIVDNGVLVLNKSGGAAAIAGPMQLGAGNANVAILRMGAANQFASGVVVTGANSAVNFARFELLGFSQTLAGVQDSVGSVKVQNGGRDSGAAANATLTLNGSGTYLHAGALQDFENTNSGGKLLVTLSGSGTHTFSGTQIKYTGATTVGSGKLILSAATAFASPATVNSGGTLSLTSAGNLTTLAAATVLLNNGATFENLNPSNWTSMTGAVTIGSGASVTINHSSNATSTGNEGLYLDGGLLGASGTVTINALNAGSGVGFRNNSSNFAGTIIVNGIASATPFAGSGISVGGATTGLQNADIQVNGTMELLTGGIGWNNTASTTFRMGALSGSGVMVANNAAPTTLTLTLGANGHAGSFSGTIVQGAGVTMNLVKEGAGTQTLGGANTFAGTTSVTTGSILLAHSLALQFSAVTSAGITFDSSVGTHAFTFGGLSGSGNLTLADNAGAPNPVALSIGGNNVSVTYSGALSGAGSLTKIGTGTQIFSGTNSYAGSTTIGGGTVQFTKPSALYNNVQGNWTASKITVAGGATLYLNVGGANDFTPAGVGTLLANLATVNDNGLKAGSRITLDTTNATAEVVYSASISDSTGPGGGAVSLTKAGAGALVLSGANAYTGTTAINAGILRFATAASLYNDNPAYWTAANITVASGTTLGLAIGGATDLTPNSVATLLANLSTVNDNGLKAGSSVALDTSNAVGDVTLTGSIANSVGPGGGAVGFSKLGAGTLVIAGTNTYSGSTVVSGGTLKIGSSSGLSTAAAAALTLAANTTLDLNGFNVSVSDVVSSVSSATIVDNGAGAGTSYFTVANHATAINALVKDGPSRAVGVKFANNNAFAILFPLTNANTFSGGLTLLHNASGGTRLWISGAVTTVGSAGAIVSSPFGRGPIVIGEAATDRAGLYIQGTGTTIANDIVFNTSLGTDFVGIRAGATGIVLSGRITANLAPASFSAAAASTVTLSGKVTGAQGLTVSGGGSSLNVFLSNAAGDNDYQGDTSIAANRTLSVGALNQIPDGAGKGNVAVTGTLNLNGFSETINGLTGGGIVDGSSGTPTLTVGANDATQTFSGVIRNTAGTLALVKIGAGTQSLAGANTFSGSTTGSGGNLLLANSLALQNSLVSPGGITFSSSVVSRAFTFGGITGSAGLALQNDDVVPQAVALSVGNTPSTYGGSLSGAGSLTKIGTGTFTMTGVNSYTGGTTVSAGNLQLTTQAALPGPWTTTTFTVAGGATITMNVGGSGEFTPTEVTALTSLGSGSGGFLSGSRIGLDTTNAAGGSFSLTSVIGNPGGNVLGLSKLGSGTLILAAANTYTGTTLISGGAVAVAAAETPGVSGPLGKQAANATGTILTTGGAQLQYSPSNQFDYSGRFSTAAGQTFNVDTNGQNVTWATGLQGTGSSLAKSGAGTLTLAGVNTYTGATNVHAGTLKLQTPTVTLPSAIGADVWLDSADIFGEGSNPPSGSSISAWANKTVGGVGNFTRQNSSADPIFVSSGNLLNGRPLVHFQGGTLTNSTNFGSNLTVLYVGRMSGGLNGRVLSGASNNWVLGYYNGSMDASYWNVGSYVTSPLNYNTHLYAATANGASKTAYNFDVDERAFDSGNLTSGLGPNGLALGGGVGGLETSYADVGELLVFGFPLSNTQRLQMEQYLQSRWIGVLPSATAINLTASGATLDLNGVNQTIGSITGVAGTEIKLGGAALTTGGDNASTTFAGAITGAGGFTKEGTGNLTLAGPSANTYTGGTFVRQGALVLSKTAGVTAIPGSVTMPMALNPVIWMTADNQLSATSTLSFPSEVTNAGSAYFLLNGTTQTIAGLQQSESVDTKRNAWIANSHAGAPNGAPVSTTPGTLTLAGSGSYSFNGYLRDNVSPGKLNVVKSGSGTQVFTGDRIAYTGTTTVNSGTLNFLTTSLFTGAGATTVNGGTLDLTNVTGYTSTGTTTINGGTMHVTNVTGYASPGATTINGGTMSLFHVATYSSPTTINNTGTLKIDGTQNYIYAQAFNLNNGGTLEYAVSAAGASYVQLSGPVTVSGAATFNLTAPTNTQGGLLFQGGLVGTGALTINAVNPRIGAVFPNANTNFSGTMVVNGIASATAGAGSGIAVGGNATGLQNVDIQLNGTMELGNQGMGWNNVSTGTFTMGALSGSGIMVSNSPTVAVTLGKTENSGTFTGTINNGTGTINLVKVGAGTQKLAGNNVYNTTTVSAGVLQIGNGTAAGTIGSGAIVVNSPGALAFNRSDTLTAPGPISGTGGLTQMGPGTLNLSSANTYSGVTSVTGGSLRLLNGNALQNSVLSLGGGPVIFDSSVASHAFALGGLTGSANFALVDNASNVINLTIGNTTTPITTCTYSGIMSGAGSITKVGTSTQVFSGANTYTGTTTLSGGTLGAGSVEDPGVSGPFGAHAANDTGTIVFGGGILQYSAANQGDYGGRFSTSPGLAIKIDTNGQNVTFTNPISGAGTSLTKFGSGTLSLSSTGNSYTGATTVTQGVLDLGSSNAVGSTSADLIIADVAGLNASLTIGGGTLTARSITVGQNGSGTLNVSGSATVSANGNSGQGGIVVGLQNAAVGVVNQTGGTVVVNNNYLILGRYNTAQGTYNVSAGTVMTAGTASSDRRIYIGWDSAAATGTMNVTGTGNVIVNESSVSNTGSLVLGYAGTGYLNVADSATVTVNAVGDSTYGGLDAGYNGGSGTVTQTGGTVVVNDNYLILGRLGASKGVYSISGGTVKTAGTAGGSDRRIYIGWDSANATGTMNVTGTANVVVNDGNVSGTGSLVLGYFGAGFLNVADSASITVNAAGEGTYGGLDVGYQSGGRGTVTQTGGTIDVKDNFFIAAYGPNSQGTVNVSGGTLKTSGTIADVNRRFHMSYNGGAVSTFTVSGTGNVIVNADNVSGGAFIAGNGNTATVNVSGNGALTLNAGNDPAGGLAISSATTVNLNGGTIMTAGNVTGVGGNSTLNFNGGTLKASAAITVQGLILANVRNGGAVIDTNGFPITVNQVLAHSNVDGDNAADGGLTKAGDGTLTFSNAHTYTGPTTINGGNLLLRPAGSIVATSLVTVNAGGNLTIAAADSSGRTFPNNLILNGGGVHGGKENIGIGGTVSVTNGVVLQTFTASENLVLPSGSIVADGLVVGGGGGASGGAPNRRGSGGGGGQVTTFSGHTIFSGPVVVGAGGLKGSTDQDGSAGEASSVSGVSALGGGGGFSGGAAPGAVSGVGGTSGSGRAGGNSPASPTGSRPGGGGGGDSAVGGNGTTNGVGGTTGGAGGAGTFVPLTGSFYGGGGGGSGGQPGAGGVGGGGNAGGGGGAGANGAPNTGGGGGGGAGNGSTSVFGGNGGSGIVVISYPYSTIPGSLTLTGSLNVQAGSALDPSVTLTAENTFQINAQTPALSSKVTGVAYHFGGNLKVVNVAGTLTSGQNFALFDFTTAWDGVSKFANDADFNDVVGYAGGALPALASSQAYHFNYATGVLSVIDVTPMTIASVAPAVGPTNGNVTVVITGTGFAPVSGPAGVKFGANNALSYVVNSPTQITAVAPAGSGTVNVVVTGFAGVSSPDDATDGSPGSTANDFTYKTLIVHSLVEGRLEGDGSVLVNASGAWTATANVSWLHTTASGTGNGRASFHFDENTGATRSGTLTIAGETLTITQAGSAYEPVAAPMTLVSSSEVIPPDSLSLSAPYSVAVDSAGNVYVADTNYNAIHKWTAATQTTVTLISTGLTAPYGVAVDSLGNVYVADSESGGAIKKWTASTMTLSTLTSASFPAAVAVDGGGNVFFAEPAGGRIAKWDATAPSAPPTTYIGGLAFPTGVAVDANGAVYAADYGAGTVEIREANSMTSSTLIVGLSAPTGLDVDLSGNVYVADGGSIVKWTAATEMLAPILSGLANPNDVAIDATGSVYYPNTLLSEVGMLPRAFVPTAAFSPSAADGSDSTLPALPTSTNLTGIFAPTSDEPWLTVDGVSSGVVNFSYEANTGAARTGNITVLGQTFSVSQAGAAATAPTVTGVTPFIGPTTGGNVVVIVGTGFTGVLGVTFKTTDATVYTVNSATQITATVPSNFGTPELVDVRVTTSGGVSSAAGTGDDYSYATPQVTSVVTNGVSVQTLTGATWASGNPLVTVASTAGLVPGAQVSSFGAGFPVRATILSVNSATTFTLNSAPTGTQGTATTISVAIAPTKSGTVAQLTGASWSSGSTNVTVASTANLIVGQYVSSTTPGLPADVFVQSITSGTEFVLSSSATANGSSATIDVANAAIARDQYGRLVNLSGPNTGSVVQNMVVTFNQRVTLDANAFTIVNLASSVTTNSVAPATGNVTVVAAGVPGTGDETNGYVQYVLNFVAGAAVNSLTNAATASNPTYLGNAFTTLKNSLFRLETVGSRVHAMGDTGTNRNDNFWSLYGVSNPSDILITGTPGGGNDEVRVDGIALTDMYATFGSFSNATTPAYSSAFDGDLDGDVDGIDLTQLYTSFGTIWSF